MNLPFTREAFFDTFEAYNLAIWPAQVLAYALGVFAVVLPTLPGRHYDQLVSGALAGLWLWTGIVYHGIHFSRINPAAFVFTLLFVAQGLLLIRYGYTQKKLVFRFRATPIPTIGAIFIAFAMIGYPATGALLGHEYPRAPVFGITPCPLTIFTFGLLLWTTQPVPSTLIVIPALWSIVGTFAAFLLDVPQDYALGPVGVLGTCLLIFRTKQPAPPDIARTT